MTSAARGIWRNSAFVRFFMAQAASGLGSQITRFAIPLIALMSLDANAFEVGLLVAAEFAPVIVVTPFVGVLVDRIPLTRVYVLASLVSALIVAAIPILHLTGSLTVAWLCGLAVALGAARAFLDVAQYAVVPRIMPRGWVVQANSHLSATQSVLDGSGPALGGALIQFVGAPFALIADAVSFVVAAVLMRSLRADPPETQDVRPPWRREIVRGFEVLWRDWRLRALALTSSAANFLGFAYFAILPTFLIRELELQPAVMGLVLGSGTIGGVSGFILAPKLGARLGDGRVLTMGVLLTSVAIALVAVGDAVTPAFVAVLIIVGAVILLMTGLSVYNVFAVSFRQMLSPEADLGKVTASYRLLSHGAGPVGAALGGLAAGWIGLVPSLWVVAGGFGLLAIAVLASPLRLLSRDAVAEGEHSSTVVSRGS